MGLSVLTQLIFCAKCRYTTVEHDDFGHYVTSINDIYEDVNSQWYWAFTERTEAGDCFQNVG